jgi:hypothetical protein
MINALSPHFFQLEDPLGNRSSVVNFINNIQTAFSCSDPKCVKKTDNFTVFFVLLGSTSVKAACRTLMKLNPDVQPNEW